MSDPSIPFDRPFDPDEVDPSTIREILRGLKVGTSVEKLDRDSPPKVSELLRGSIWGTITWNRSLGRPAAVTPAAGIVIVHTYTKSTLHMGPEGSVAFTDELDGNPATTWDLPDDGDTMRVAFSCLWDSFDNTICPTLSAGWQHPSIFAGPVRFEPRCYPRDINEHLVKDGTIRQLSFEILPTIRP
jgi:hypothetical protein